MELLRSRSGFGIVALVLLVVASVAGLAWVSEDSFITFRYISNTLAGLGPVFNPSERVLGYTHPLWFLLLLPGTLLIGDPILAAIGYGLLLTLITMLLLGQSMERLRPAALTNLGVFLLAVIIFLSSDAWLSFQTGGLENPLSHLLIVLIIRECVTHANSRPALLVLQLTLLCMCRPDFVFFGFPIGLFALGGIRGRPDLTKCSLAAAPGLGWLLFAWLYYGNPLPNTGTAKLGIFPSWEAAVAQGFTYLYDWLIFEPVAVVGGAALLVSALLLRRDRAGAAIAVGIALQLGWSIWTGGDFMRGRFFVAVLTAAVCLGALTLAAGRPQQRRTNVRAMWAVAASLVLATLFSFSAAPGLRDALPARVSGIVSERSFYRDYSLSHYLANDVVAHPMFDLGIAADLRDFANTCGPVTIHITNPGTVGYLAGPDVSLIDTLGLTDRFIAQLPPALLVQRPPRPGHPEKYIPVAYLADRGDVAIFDDWIDRISTVDCSLLDEISPFSQSNYYLTPDARFVKIEFATK